MKVIVGAHKMYGNTEVITEDNPDVTNYSNKHEYYDDEYFYNIITNVKSENGASSDSPSRNFDMSLDTAIQRLHQISLNNSIDTQATDEEDIDEHVRSDNNSIEENLLNVTPDFNSLIHRNVLDTSPTSELARDNLLRLVRIDKYQQALKQADEYLQWDNSDTEVLYAKGYCYYAMGQYEKAIEHFEKVTISQPTHVRALTKLKKVKSLKDTLEEGDVFFISRKWEKALDVFDKALQIDYNSINLQIRVHRKKADIYLKLGKRYRAVEEYTNALLFDENCLEALRDRAKCYEENCGDYERAIKDFEKIYSIVEIKSLKQWARNCIVSIERKIKHEQHVDRAESLMEIPTPENVESALKLVEDCLQFNKYDTRAICVKGSCLYYKGEYEEALNQFTQVQSLEESHPKAKREIDKIKRLIGALEKYSCSIYLCHFEDALSHLNEAINIGNSNASLVARLYCKRAAVYLKLNQTCPAIQEYSAALRLDEKCLDVLRGRAQCYEEAEDFVKAVEDYKNVYSGLENGNIELCEEEYTSLEIENMKQHVLESISTLEALIAYREKIEQVEKLMEERVTPQIVEALNVAEKCLELKKLDTRALCVKGSCLYYLGQYGEALTYFQSIPHDKRSHSTALTIDKISRLTLIIQRGDDAFKSGKWHDAIKHFDEALNVDETNAIMNAGIICKKAAVYWNLDEISSAIQQYSTAIGLDDMCLNALLGRAQCYEKVEEYENAIEDYEQIYSKVEDADGKNYARDAIATLERKIAYREKVERAERLMEENLELAMELADECVQPDADAGPLTRALFVKGSCLYYRGQYKDAVDQFQEILRLVPSHTAAQEQFNKISTLIDMLEAGNTSLATGQTRDALFYFKEALNIDERKSYLTVKLHCEIAGIFLKLEDICGAIEEYTTALYFDNVCVEAMRGRAICYVDVGDYIAAIDDYSLLCEIEEGEQNKQWARDRLAEARALEEDKRKRILDNLTHAVLLIQRVTFANVDENVGTALELVEKCLQLDEHEISALEMKGFCLYLKGQYKDAVDQYQEILRLVPSHSTAEKQLNKVSRLKYLIEEGEKSLAAGRLQEALNCFKDALSIDERKSYITVRSHCKIAEVYLGLKNICLAIKEYTVALDYHERCVDALWGRAKAYADSNDYDKAIEDYSLLSKIEKCEEDKQRARERLAEVERNKRIKEKVAVAESLVQGVKTGNVANVDKNVESALKLVEDYLQLESNNIRALCVKGSCLYYKGEYEEALRQFERVLSLEPSHSAARTETDKISRLRDALAKGTSAFVAKNWDDALNSYNEALTIDDLNKPLRVGLYCKKAAIYLKLNDTNEAIAEYTNALSVDSECVEALKGRAECYTNVDRYEDAANDYEKLYLLDGSEETKKLVLECETLYNNYRSAQEIAERGLELYTQQNYNDALALFEEAIRLCPDSAEYRVHAFSCCKELLHMEGMLDKAEMEAKKAVELYVKSSKYISGIAKCYIALGDISGAENVIIKSSAAGISGTLDSGKLGNIKRLRGMAQKYIDESNYKEALKCVEQCLQDSPLSSQVKLLKAECLVMLGRNDEAMKIANKCLESDRSAEADARFIKVLWLYYDDDLERALKCLIEMKQRSLLHKRAQDTYEKAKTLKEKKQAGDEAFKRERWDDAIELYEAALEVDPTHGKANAKLHLNMAVALRRREPDRAVDESAAALELHEKRAALTPAQREQALSLRAECLTELGEHDAAVDDYEILYRDSPCPEYKERLDRAKKARDESWRNMDYYGVLGLRRPTTEIEIDRAYKKLVKLYHSDKHSGTFQKSRQDKRLQKIQRAKNELLRKCKNRTST